MVYNGVTEKNLEVLGLRKDKFVCTTWIMFCQISKHGHSWKFWKEVYKYVPSYVELTPKFLFLFFSGLLF